MQTQTYPQGFKQVNSSVIIYNNPYLPTDCEVEYEVLYNPETHVFVCLMTPEWQEHLKGDVTIPHAFGYVATKWEFTNEEKQEILDYQQLDLETDSFDMGDVFVQGKYIVLHSYTIGNAARPVTQEKQN